VYASKHSLLIVPLIVFLAEHIIGTMPLSSSFTPIPSTRRAERISAVENGQLPHAHVVSSLSPAQRCDGPEVLAG